MAHPLIDQMRFTRREWQRALNGLSEEDAQVRIQPMNCISWMVGHLAWHEQKYWLQVAQGFEVAPHLEALVGSRKPASTPALNDMWKAWEEVTEAAEGYLDRLTINEMASFLNYRGQPLSQSIGTMLQRVIYHYWYHTGEAMAIRQVLKHSNLPDFVGDIGTEAPYRAE